MLRRTNGKSKAHERQHKHQHSKHERTFKGNLRQR